MSTQQYTEEELQRYFDDPKRHRRRDSNGTGSTRPQQGIRGFFHRRFDDPAKARAAFALSTITGAILLFTFSVGIYVLFLADDLPSLEQIENPELDLATVAYTVDGEELARYAYQNRSWVPYDSISPHVVNALVATEDHRFYQHWGVDTRGIFAALGDIFLRFDLRGASTISQQLARNLYNDQIGFDVSLTRKLKEAVTAIQLERRYTKQEIIEMYLNTVPFGYRSYGIEAAGLTFFSTPASRLDVLQSATLIGMLQATTYYNPVRNPENAQRRRNVVMRLMVKQGYLSPAFYEAHRDDPVETDFNRNAEITSSFAPYFAEYVRNWLNRWGEQNEHDIYSEGLVVYTTMDARLQTLAEQSVAANMNNLQAVVDYEWSRSGPVIGPASGELDFYQQQDGYEPFSYFWSTHRTFEARLIRETRRYANLRKQDVSPSEAVQQLRQNDAFLDSLHTAATRLEAGFVAIDPRTGHVKAWVGGRDLETDWYDHVAIAKRQPGSTFKPFVYTTAIDNGYSPEYTLLDSTFTYVNPETDQEWSPQNSGRDITNEMLTLREGLARSKNTISGRLILEIGPGNVAFYARRMGIESRLEEVPSLALGTSDVTLLELISGYTTLANGGLRNEPTVVTRIEDRFGNVLYEAEPQPSEALSEETAYTVVDMMRDVIRYGTGIRIRTQYGLREYDLAGKTGTTQNGADGWFVAMHPELVTGAWVGFNHRQVTFRSNWWGQGAHNALFLVGDFLKSITESPEIALSKEAHFPMPEMFGDPYVRDESGDNDNTSNGDRVGW